MAHFFLIMARPYHCTSKEELITLLRESKRESEEMGLLANAKKTKITVVDENSPGGGGYSLTSTF